MANHGDIGKITQLLETKLSALATASSYDYMVPFAQYHTTGATVPLVRSVELSIQQVGRRSTDDQWIANLTWKIACELQGSQAESAYKIQEVASVICVGLSRFTANEDSTTHRVHLDECGIVFNLLGADGEGTETIQTATITVNGQAFRESGATIVSR